MTETSAAAVVAVGMKRLAEELYHTQHTPRSFLLLGEGCEPPEVGPLNVVARPLSYGCDCMDLALQKMKSNPFQQTVNTCNDDQ